MRQQMLEAYIAELRKSFGKSRLYPHEELLAELYSRRDYPGLVREIKGHLNLDLTVRVGIVNSGGRPAPAWINMLNPSPMYGTAEFRSATVGLFMRRAFLEEVRFEQTVMAIAHELSHVLLWSTYHPLRFEEPAVDLTAMLLGFRDFFVTGVHTTQGGKVLQTGYLTKEEVSYAAHFMTYR